MKLNLENQKQKVIVFYATIGIAATITLIGYTLNECLKELYTAHAKTIIINQAPTDKQDAGDSGEGTDEPDELRIAQVSAYTSEIAQTDGSPYITADGTNLKTVYECVIASNDYEFGTRLAIEKLGVCTVHDRMNQRYTGTGNIDVYFGNDKQRALEFGRQNLSYLVIK